MSAKGRIQKIAVIVLILQYCISCDKGYDCVCYSSIQQSDTIMDHVVTTKLGVKGWTKTCQDYPNSNKHLSNCRVE